MSLTDYSTTLKGRLNAALPGFLSTILQTLKFGDIVRAMRTVLRGKTVDASTSPYVLPTAVNSIALPEDAKAMKIDYVYARAGAGTKGPLTVDYGLYDAVNTAPAAGHCSVSPNGDLLFASADAWTAVDISYVPEKYDVVELTLPVTSDALTIPAATVARGVLFMLEAESLAGGLVSKMIVQKPVDAKPATTKASLKLAKDVVQFAVADAVTSARVKLAVASAVDVNALLEATSSEL